MDSPICQLHAAVQQHVSNHPDKLEQLLELLQKFEKQIFQLRKKNIDEFGYYTYIVSDYYLKYIKLESNKINKYKGHKVDYEKEYQQQLNYLLINKSYQKIIDLISNSPQDLGNLQDNLIEFESQLEDFTDKIQIIQYRYYKYLVADINISYLLLQLTESEKKTYLKEKQIYEKDYLEYKEIISAGNPQNQVGNCLPTNEQKEKVEERNLIRITLPDNEQKEKEKIVKKVESEKIDEEDESQQIENINLLIYKLNEMVKTNPSEQQISSVVKDIQAKTKILKNAERDQLDYYSYIIAGISLTHLQLSLSENQKKCYQKDITHCKDNFDKISKQIMQKERNNLEKEFEEMKQQIMFLIHQDPNQTSEISSLTTKLEVQINEQIDEMEFELYGYYTYLIAKIQLEFVLTEESKYGRNKYLSNLTKYKKEYTDHLIRIISNYLEQIELIIKKQPKDIQKLSTSVRLLENKVKELEELDLHLFNKYQTIVAEISLSHLNLQECKKKQQEQLIMKEKKQMQSIEIKINNYTDMKKIEDQINKYVEESPIDEQKIKLAFKELEKQIETIQASDKKCYGYYKFYISNIYPQYFDLSQSQKIDYLNQAEKYQEDYFNFIDQQQSIERQTLSLQHQTVSNEINCNNQKEYQTNNPDSSETNNQLNKINTYDTSVNQIKYDIIKKRIYLLLGLTGVGKSSFIKHLTKNERVGIGHKSISYTQECEEFQFQNEINFIDSPGIDDTHQDRYITLLKIVEYLHYDNTISKIQKFNLEKKHPKVKYTPNDIFILLIQNNDLKLDSKIIQEFAYAYFLYEMFQEKLTPKELETFINEYNYSSGLLNWTECNLHGKSDNLADKRRKIFSEKDLALKYQQDFNNYHIVIKTHFDYTVPEDLNFFDEDMVEYLHQQIWSNVTEDFEIFDSYKNYIKNQEQHLFSKIQKITETQNENDAAVGRLDFQNIVLIGNSQVGKSSLIEQITGLSGLRGSGEQSTTNFCQTYIIESNKIKYRFIDTPGFEGTEQNSQSFQCLKIISDYLRRNRITEFKILFMVRNTEVRDKMKTVLSKLFVFLDKMFDDDISFLDSEYLMSLFMPENNQTQNWKYEIDFIQDKILKVENQFAKIKKGNKENNDNQENLQIKTISFKSNYFSQQKNKVTVDDKLNKEQIETLYKTLLEINSINMEEKLIVKVNQLSQIRSIINPEIYAEEYLKILILYKYLELIRSIQIDSNSNQQNLDGNLFSQITSIKEDLKAQILINQKRGETEIQIINNLLQELQQIKPTRNCEELKTLTKLKLKILQELDQSQFIMNLQLIDTSKIKTLSQKYCWITSKLKNDVAKHFILLKQDSYLFEDQPNLQYLLISRKQLFFSVYYHQLSCFMNKDNQKHIEKLEELAQIKSLSDIALQSLTQKKYWEKLYSGDTDAIYQLIKDIAIGLNLMISSGIQIYRLVSYITIDMFQRQFFSASIYKVTIFGFWATCILSAVSIGIDIYSFAKKQMSTQQLCLNSSINLSVCGFTIAAFFLPGVGWIIGGAAGLVALAAFGVSAGIFTHSSTFDQTIGVFIKDFIEEPNFSQNLLYFQKSDFFLTTFNPPQKLEINTYQELLGKGYDQYRELEKNQFETKKQKQILEKLFPKKENEDFELEDTISNHISKVFIYKKFKQQHFDMVEQEKPEEYLKRISEDCKQNQRLINTFYNKFQSQKLEKIKKYQTQLIKQVDSKLEKLKKDQEIEKKKQDDGQRKLLNDVKKDIIPLEDQLKKSVLSNKEDQSSEINKNEDELAEISRNEDGQEDEEQKLLFEDVNDDNHKDGQLNDLESKYGVWEKNEKQVKENYKKYLKEFLTEISKDNYEYKDQVEFGNGFWRKCDRFPILFRSYCNLKQAKVEYKFKNSSLISDFSKDESPNGFSIKLKDVDLSCLKINRQQTRDERIKMMNLLCLCEKFTLNRYLIKTEGQSFNIVSIAKKDILDAKVIEFVDLYELYNELENELKNEKKQINFEDFLKKIKSKTNNESFDIEQTKRLLHFYQSIPFLKEEFNYLG